MTSDPANGTPLSVSPVAPATQGAVADDHARRGFGGDAAWTLTVLLGIYIMSMFVRNIVAMLVPEMKVTLALSDFQVGLALGPAFSLSYALFSLPLGWAADRYSRRVILLLGTMLFGAATIATGLVGGFASLLVARILVGVGESALGPASGSLLAAKVTRARLATAISIYMTGTKIGTSIAYALPAFGLAACAALIADWRLDGIADWQLLMILCGVPALAIGLLMLSVAEPARRAPVAGEAPQTIFGFLKAERALLVPTITAFALMALCANSLVGWVPTYMTRAFGWSKATFGPILGVYSIAAAATLVVKGMIVDWLYRRGVKDVHVRFYSWIVAGTLPLAWALFLVPDPTVFLILLAVVQVVAVPVTSYAATLVQVITPPALRGQMAAVSALFLVSIGGLGPSLVGALNDFVFRDEALLGRSLACVTITIFPLTLLFLRMSLRPLRARIAEVEAAAY